MTGFIDVRLKMLLFPAISTGHAPIAMVRKAWRIVFGEARFRMHNHELALSDLRTLLCISGYRWAFIMGDRDHAVGQNVVVPYSPHHLP